MIGPGGWNLIPPHEPAPPRAARAAHDRAPDRSIPPGPLEKGAVTLSQAYAQGAPVQETVLRSAPSRLYTSLAKRAPSATLHT